MTNQVVVEREYEYKPSWLLLLLCGGLFGLAAGCFAAWAVNNNRGLIINGIITLSTGGATVFYWVLCLLSVGFVAMAAVAAIHRMRVRQRIAFTNRALIVPASRWSADEQIIEYSNITDFSSVKIQGQRFLYITHTGGRFTLNAVMLRSKRVFEEVTALLEQRVQNARK